MADVVLIDPLEVPEAKREGFLQTWVQIAAQMRMQPGFVSGALHRSLEPDAKFPFISIAVWRSPADCHLALNSSAIKLLTKDMAFPHQPVLYEVISNLRMGV